MSFRQDRTNPSTAISQWKGRSSTKAAWPSTKVSTWMNGGLFGGASDSWVLSLDLVPGASIGTYGIGRGIHIDQSNEDIYFSLGSDGDDPFMGRFTKDGEQVWCTQFDPLPGTDIQSNARNQFLELTGGADGEMIWLGRCYRSSNAAYPAVWMSFDKSDGSINWTKSIGDSAGWLMYTSSRGKEMDDEYAIVYAFGFYSAWSGSGSNVCRFNSSGTMGSNARLYSGSQNNPGDVVYGSGSTVSSSYFGMFNAYSSAAEFNVNNIYGSNMNPPGTRYRMDTNFGNNYMWDCGEPRQATPSSTYSNLYPLSIADSAFKLAKIPGFDNTTAVTWARTITLTDSGNIASVRDSGGGSHIAVDGDENLYVLARDFGASATQDAVYIIKYDTDGTMEWNRAFIFSNTAISSPGSSPPYRAAIDCSDTHVYVAVGLADGDGYSYIIKYKNDGSALGTATLPGNWSCEVVEGLASSATLSLSAMGTQSQSGNGASYPYSFSGISASKSDQTPTVEKAPI